MPRLSITLIRRSASGRRRETKFETETQNLTLDQQRKLLEFEQLINSFPANLRLHIGLTDSEGGIEEHTKQIVERIKDKS